MNDQPIFIAGPDRSGTTLLYALLASHPNIAMVRRTNFWRWFYGRYGDLRQPQNVDRLLQRVLEYKRMQRLQPDGERLRREFFQGEPSYGRLFGLLLQHNADRLQKPRWGDKSLHTELYFDQIMKEFPRARCIHMVRDPRDRYASVRKRFGRDTPRLGAATARWLISMRAGLRNQARYPEQYLFLRFEDLASRPEETARAICAFIGEDYVPAMLNMEGASEYRNSGGNSSFNQIQPGTISTRPIGRYRSILTPFELKFIQQFSGALLRRFQYVPDPVPLTVAENAEFIVRFAPYHLLRLAGWWAIHTAQMVRKPPAPANRFQDAEETRKGNQVKSHV